MKHNKTVYISDTAYNALVALFKRLGVPSQRPDALFSPGLEWLGELAAKAMQEAVSVTASLPTNGKTAPRGLEEWLGPVAYNKFIADFAHDTIRLHTDQAITALARACHAADVAAAAEARAASAEVDRP